MNQKQPWEYYGSLPTEIDFDPYGGCLDAQCAWKNFGGLNMVEAHWKFREAPENYQEDFIFMGGKAFAYYFPVIESYLLETPDPNDRDEIDFRPTCILAYCIQSQFTGDSLPYVIQLASRVQELIAHIHKTIGIYEAVPKEQKRILEAWDELEAHMQQLIHP